MCPDWEMTTSDSEDFNRRWLKARLSAFPADPSGNSGITPGEASAPLEAELLERFPGFAAGADAAGAEAKDALLRKVFDNSRKLALGLSKRFGVTFEPADFQSLLAVSGIPCARGTWSARPNARVLTRDGCSYCGAAGSGVCDYWREAMDGLVMGLGDKERFARHGSVRHGDGECIDVFFTEAEGGGKDPNAWGPLPEHMALELFEAAAWFEHEYGVPMELKGYREGVLYYALGASTDPLCGTAGLSINRFIGRVREIFPGLGFADATPQAVLGTGTG